MRLFFVSWVIFALASCAHHSAPPSKGNIRMETEWTAGIISQNSTLPSTRPAGFAAVRTARHDGYDRVVFEFSGDVIPGYHLEYIDEPVRSCGSGQALFLPGDGWLMMRFEPARMHDEGRSTITERDRRPGLPTILRLVSTCDFENIVTWVAAVSSPNRYRVTELANPMRLAVDIRH
ncbi:MAG: hypothetical protein ACLFTB_04940 [Desulfovibrionales bacterium]